MRKVREFLEQGWRRFLVAIGARQYWRDIDCYCDVLDKDPDTYGTHMWSCPQSRRQGAHAPEWTRDLMKENKRLTAVMDACRENVSLPSNIRDAIDKYDEDTP